jgi:hypothetical protein
MIGYRNRALAEKAWHCQKNQFCNQQHSKEFKDGFTEGFMEVAAGGNGCVPAVAPKQYWGWRYQSAQGQSAVNAWFQGYPMGVRAAEQAGVGHWGEVRTAGYHNQTPQAVPVGGGANPFYGDPAGQLGVTLGSTGSPAYTAPGFESMQDSQVSLDSGSIDAIDDVIDLDFDSASTQASPNQSGFGNQPVFASASDARVAGRENATESSSVSDSVIVDEVFGAGNAADSAVGDALPFSFE